MLAHGDIQSSTTARRAPAESFAYASIGLILFSCLFLQRFVVPLGDLRLHVTTLVTLAIVACGILVRALSVNVASLMLYVLFAAGALACSLIASEVDRRFMVRTSLPSLLHMLVLYVPFVFRSAVPLDQQHVLRIVRRLLMVVAVTGILQFLLQFVGIASFTFRQWVPDQYLIEDIFNVVIPITYGATRYKSNGFFLVEPSVFSQMMAIAIMLEILVFKRVIAACIFGTALFFALSGTGLMVLAIFFAFFVATLRSERMSELVVVGVLGLVVYLVATTIFGEFAQNLLDRRDEFFDPRSSGYQRFVTPFLLMARLAEHHPASLLWGIGPGSAESIDFGFVHWINTPAKLIIEYGVPVFLIWLTLFVRSAARRGNAIVLWPVVYLMLFTGGYQQFPPVIYFVFAMFVFNRAPDWTFGAPGQSSRSLRPEAPALP